MKINMNTKVKVELTDFGEMILKKVSPVDFKFYKEGKKKYYEDELWYIMAIFGDCFYSRMPYKPFVGNEIIVELEGN